MLIRSSFIALTVFKIIDFNRLWITIFWAERVNDVFANYAVCSARVNSNGTV